MYERDKEAARCAVGFDRGVEGRGGSMSRISSEPLVAMWMDRLTEEVRQDSPWTMTFADDIAVCAW